MNDKNKFEYESDQSFGPVARIVAGYAQRSDVTQDDIIALTQRLIAVFSGTKTPSIKESAVAPAPAQSTSRQRMSPAIPIEKAVTDEKVYCLCCGKGFTMLKRHLKAEHGLTEDEYRAMFDLPEDFPLVAPNYSERKAAYAKQVGLGKYTREIEGGQGATAG